MVTRYVIVNEQSEKHQTNKIQAKTMECFNLFDCILIKVCVLKAEILFCCNECKKKALHNSSCGNVVQPYKQNVQQ